MYVKLWKQWKILQITWSQFGSILLKILQLLMPMPGRVIEPSLETKLLNIYLYYIGVRMQIKFKNSYTRCGANFCTLFIKKSTIFIQSSWYSGNFIYSWVNHFHQVSYWLGQNCRFCIPTFFNFCIDQIVLILA